MSNIFTCIISLQITEQEGSGPIMKKYTHHVFISYSSKDSYIARDLADRIEQKGVRCWYAERDIPDGTVWATEIDEAIHCADIFIVIVSRNSAASKQVPKEIGLAIESCRVVMPLRIDHVQLEGAFRYYLSDCQWTDITPDQDDKLNEVADTVFRISSRTDIGNHRPSSLPRSAAADSGRKINRAVIAVLCLAIASAMLLILSALFVSRRSDNSIADNTTEKIVSTEENISPEENAAPAEDIPPEENDAPAEDISPETESEPVPLPSQTTDTDTLFFRVQDAYTAMLDTGKTEIHMSDYLSEYKDADIDSDGTSDDIMLVADPETYSGDIVINFSSSPSLRFTGDPERGLGRAGFVCPAQVLWADIDKDGVNEILIKQSTSSTAGIVTYGYLYKLTDSGWEMTDDPYNDLSDVIDIQISADGIFSLHNAGRKNGSDQYWDYMGTRCILNGLSLHEDERSKNLARECWPYEYWTMDTSNYSAYDFTVTDEAISQLKESLNLGSDYIYVTVGNVFYYERRNIYLKEVTFRNSDGSYEDGCFVDKYNNIIDISEY